MRAILTLLVIAGLAAGGYFLWKHKPAKEETENRITRPTTAVVEATNINFAVTVAGEIAPAEQVSVRPEINGKISTLNVDVGDKVKKGAVLFTLDDKELQNQKSSSVTEIDRARLQVEQADRNYKRNQELFASKLLSLEAYESSRTDLLLASNALERAQRELSVLDEKLSKTVLVAPFDCTVLTRPVSIGQAVAGSGGMSGGTEVLTIADLNQMVINAHVNQADVPRLKVGQQVQVAVEAVVGLHVAGLVDRIAPQATIRNNIKGFATRIAIREIDPRIQPGMTANITIPVASVENVLAVPLAAVFTEQGERFVYVKKSEEEFEKRPVQIGISDYFCAEVMSGLRAGEVVSLEVPSAELSKLGKGPGKMGANGGTATGPALAGSTREGAGGIRMSRTNAPGGERPPRTSKSGT